MPLSMVDRLPDCYYEGQEEVKHPGSRYGEAGLRVPGFLISPERSPMEHSTLDS